jgi:hypothetical protein
MSQTLFELRIYSGLHAGAKVSLSGLDQTIVLGSASDNDVILRDAHFKTAQITLTENGWRWLGLDAEKILPWGACVKVEELVIGVAYLNSAWPEVGSLTIGWEPVASADLAQHSPQPETVVESDVSPDNALALAPEPKETPTFLAAKAKPDRKTAKYIVLAGLVLGMVWAVFLLQSPRPQPIVAESEEGVRLPTGAAAPTSTDQLAMLRNAVKATGYDHHIRIVPQPEGKFQLIGVLANEAQLDELLRAASAVTRKIFPSVLIQSEFVARLNALQPQLPAGIVPQALPVGVVGIQSQADQATSVAQAKELIQRELPELVSFQITNPEPASSVAQQPSEKPLAARPNSRLPKVAAIQSGPHSYVLLASGQKVMPGGGFADHKLLRIEDNALVLEDKSGQTIRWTR